MNDHDTMARYVLTLQYDGTDFIGWQSQPSGRTIQTTIEERIQTILREPLPIVGAGRTDTGVHARKMMAHIDFSESREEELPELFFRLNRFLPHDITICSLHKVSPEFHARFSATSRTYRYYISLVRSPFTRHFYTYVPWALDFELMNETAQSLLGTKDFTTFSKSHTDVYTHICQVKCAQWKALGNDTYCFEITANRFLRNMVRATVGTLMDVGRGKITKAEFIKRLELKDRTQNITTAPATGLFLEEITYPEELIGDLLWKASAE